MASVSHTNARFFSHPTLVSLSNRSVFIDLGDHNGDSLLRGIAGGILDKKKIDVSVINTLMSYYLARFPEERKILNSVSAAERLKQLALHTRPGKLIQKIAYTLGKIVADEFSHNDAYADLIINGELTAAAITHDGGWSAITALSKALPMLPIEVLVVEPNKPLFKRVSFNTEKQNPNSVVLQMQNGYYRPRLASSVFSTAVLLPVSELNQIVEASSVSQVGDSSDGITVALTEQEHLVAVFEDVYRRLFAMVVAGELDVDALKNIYAKSTTERSDNLSQRFGQGIFDGVVAAHGGLHTSQGQDALFAGHLVYSISKAISFGQMDKDGVFGLVDAVQSEGIRARV
jgi:hypothetical protein